MKVRALLYVCLFVMSAVSVMVKNAIADTNVSGYISTDTTWTSSNSPYVVTGNIIVNSGVTLTIEAGVTVKLDSGKALQVKGTLKAQGSSSSKITFTKNSNSNWGYLLFNDSSTDASYDSIGNYTSGSIMEYCVVENAGSVSESNYGAIMMDNAHPFINYCTIQNNSISGIYAYDLSGMLKITNSTISNNSASSDGGGIYCSGGTKIISNNTISNNTSSGDGGGMYCYSGTTTISYNTISNNSSSSFSGGGMYCLGGTKIISNNTISNNTAYSLGGGIYCSSGTNDISNNTINNNNSSRSSSSYGGGIYCNSGTYTISKNTVSNNTAYSRGGGIYCAAGTFTISNNTISDNTGYKNGNGGGIYCSGGTNTISNNHIVRNSAANASAIWSIGSSGKYFQYNTITGNKTTGSSSCTVYIKSNTDFSESSSPIFNYNNVFSNSATYELWNDNDQSSSNLDAKNNWWGTTDDSAVQGKIYDWIDDSTKGSVDYAPYATLIRIDCPISPPTGLTATAGAEQITLSWTANSESDTTGYEVCWDTDSGHAYANSVDVGNVTSYTINNLTGSKYYVTVTAYDTSYSAASDDSSTIVNENQTNGNESWYAEEQSVTFGAATTTTTSTTTTSSTTTSSTTTTTLPSPVVSPTVTPSPTSSPTPAPIPTASPSKTGMVYGTVNDSYEDSLEGVTVTIEGEGISEITETDEDGYYEFQRLVAGNYTLTYELEGYVTQTQEISLNEGEKKYLETITMPMMGSIYGYVVNVRGEEINKARLRLKGIGTKFTETKYSDADGYFDFTELESDTYLIFARKRGYLPKKLRVKLREGEEKDVGEITLRRKS